MKRIIQRKNFAISALAAAISMQVHAESFEIKDIQVEGLQRVSASPVFAALPLQVGDSMTRESIRSAIRSLFATGFFDDVQVFHDGNILIIRVKERPTISEISIDGNKAIKTENLEDAMSSNDLAEGQIFQRSTLDGILNELERQYVAQGRYGAEVEAKVVELPNNQIKVEVLVDEGEVATIKHLNIVGNNVFSDEELIGLFELTTTGMFSWITSDDRYAREKLKGDIEKLESYYLDRGYLDFEIVSSQVSLSPDQKSVYITLNIKEGEVYTVDKIDLAGELIVGENAIRPLILLRSGRTFSQNLMTSTSEYITTLMGNAGYTNAEVEGIPEPDPETNKVNVTFLVNPGNRVFVRRIDFRGNTRTEDEVLRREMRQMEGASASNAKIEQGKVRLERLGFFKEVEVEHKEVPGTSDLIDVEYTVEEQPSGSVNASLGYGQAQGLLLGASLQQNNWMGTGKQVSVSINHSKYQTQYNFSYTDPYYTPDGVSRGISLFYRSLDYGKINLARYTTDSYGANLTFGYPVSEIQRLDFSLGYTHLEIDTGTSDVQEIRRTPPELDLENNTYFYIRETDLADGISNENGLIEDFTFPTALVEQSMLSDTDLGFVDLYGDTFDTFSTRAAWVRSTLNRGIMATRGSKQTLSIDVSVPGSDLQYFTVKYDGQLYMPLSEDFTLRFKTSLGYGDGYGEMKRLPFFRNFYGGGFGSIRGFRKSSLGPQASPPSGYVTNPVEYTAIDTDGDGVNDNYSSSGQAYILMCDEAQPGTSEDALCDGNKLAQFYGTVSRRNRSFGGNLLIEFGTELLFPIPFVDDQRSMQTMLFVDAGNVFDTECSDTQLNCSNFDLDEMRVSAGIGVNWLSPMGPLTFSLATAIKHKENDDREGFQFELGVPF